MEGLRGFAGWQRSYMYFLVSFHATSRYQTHSRLGEVVMVVEYSCEPARCPDR